MIFFTSIHIGVQTPKPTIEDERAHQYHMRSACGRTWKWKVVPLR